MKDTTLFLSLAAMSCLSSCSMEPCFAHSLQNHIETCRNCSGSAVHLGSAEEHVKVCPETADNREHYAVQPGT